MSEIVPSFDDYHQAQIRKTFRTIGRYLVDSLIKAGECLSLKLPNTEASDRKAITDAEIRYFVSQSETMEFDRELEALIRENPID